MSGTLYLGRSLYDGKTHTRVEPIAVVQHGAWRLAGDLTKALPTEGRVFAPSKPPFVVGVPFAFDVLPNAYDGPDRTIVGRTWPVDPILDLSDRTWEDARRLVVEVGIPGAAVSGGRLVVALDGGRCVVLSMVEDPLGRGLVAAIEGLEVLPVFDIDRRALQGMSIEGRRFIVPGQTVGQRVGTLDWRRDADFLDSALKRLRRISGADGGPTRAQIGPLVSYLVKAGLSPGLGDDLVPMRDRLVATGKAIALNVEAAEAIAAALVDLPPIAERLRVEVEARREELVRDARLAAETTARAEIEAALSGLRAEVSTMERRREEAASLAYASRAEADQLEAHRAMVASALTAELVALGEQFDDASSQDASLLAERLSARLKRSGIEAEFLPDPRPSWTRLGDDVLTEPLPWDVAGAALAAAAKRCGFSSSDILAADIAARAGSLVVLPEATAARFVACYAGVASAGRFVRQSLDPSILSIDDLWRQPPNGTATALATAWTRCRLDPRRFRIVLLEGLHRTPLDLWLPSLLDVAAEPSRPANLLLFASLTDRMADASRCWFGLGSRAVPLCVACDVRAAVDGIDRVSGRSATHTWLDASPLPAVRRGTLADLLNDIDETASADAVARLPSIYQAALAILPDVEATVVATSFVRQEHGDVGTAVEAGRAWVGQMESTWENRR